MQMILLTNLRVCPSSSFSVLPSPFRIRQQSHLKHSRCAVVMKGVLSRSSIMTSTTKSKKYEEHHSYLDKSFLLEVLDEALYRQNSALEALDREIEKRKLDEYALNEVNKKELELEERSSDIFDRVEARKKELHDLTSKLQGLRSTLEQTNSSQNKFEQIKTRIDDLGYGTIFRQPIASWKTKQARDREFGRPQGFDGEIFFSPLGVPILVGRMNAHKDEVMRNAAQGSDLWFQVEDYNGSRVLLRTSLMRGTKGSKQCRQMAADLAAKYSEWGDDYDTVPVMYTDSRKVAKRGSKIGRMKQKKSLGRILGMPRNV
jgi:predicted ribosome quality control (RQC) complex YloA/Tae2 family protein